MPHPHRCKDDRQSQRPGGPHGVMDEPDCGPLTPFYSLEKVVSLTLLLINSKKVRSLTLLLATFVKKEG